MLNKLAKTLTMSNESEVSNAIVSSDDMPVSNVQFEDDLLKEKIYHMVV